MHANNPGKRAKLPRQLVEVGIELDAHRARRVDLRVRDLIWRGDVAQARRFANLIVERHQRKAEREHDHHDDAELQQQCAVGLRRFVALVVAHSRLCLRALPPIAINRNPIMPKPSTLMPIVVPRVS